MNAQGSLSTICFALGDWGLGFRVHCSGFIAEIFKLANVRPFRPVTLLQHLQHARLFLQPSRHPLPYAQHSWQEGHGGVPVPHIPKRVQRDFSEASSNGGAQSRDASEDPAVVKTHERGTLLCSAVGSSWGSLLPSKGAWTMACM